MTWQSPTPPASARPSFGGWIRIVLRIPPLALLVFGGLAFLLALRCIERPIFGAQRPITPWITQGVCIGSLWICGLRYRRTGSPMRGAGAAVANHTSWLDIFALNAGDRLYFVSKSEVAGWPGIGWLARATGTLFIERKSTRAAEHANMIKERLELGHRLLFFPEGTSTDGRQVLPFKTTLFQPFLSGDLSSQQCVQPICLRYSAPLGEEDRFYGWWGDMGFGPHLLSTLAAGPGGSVSVDYLAPLRVQDFENRKALAKACEIAVHAAHAQESTPDRTAQAASG